MDRRVGNGAREVNAPHRFQSSIVNRRPILVRKRQADVPFTIQRRLIAVRAQHAGEGQPILRDETGATGAGEDSTIIDPKRHLSRHDAVAGRCANRRRTVRIREAHTLGGQAIQIGRRNPRLRIIATDVAVAEVVGEDKKNVRLLGRGQRSEEKGEQWNNWFHI